MQELKWLPSCEPMGDTVSTLLFQPPPPTKLREHKIVWIKTERGSRIPAFYISYRETPDGVSSASVTRDDLMKNGPGPGITVLYSHANAEDLGSIYPWCKYLSKMLKVNIFAYDYTGYGMAYDQGPPSEEHCYADIDAAYGFLRNTLSIPASNIVLFGRSLGSGPSCHLAAGSASESRDDSKEGPVGGLILHAPFLSVYRIVLDSGCTLYGDKFPNIDLCPMMACPVVLIHGSDDQIVPFHHSKSLYEAIPVGSRTKPIYIEGMGHNNVHSQVRPYFIERLNEYLDEYVRPSIDKKGLKTNSVRKMEITVRGVRKQTSIRNSGDETIRVQAT